MTEPGLVALSKYLIKTHYIVRVMEVHPETQTVDVIQDNLEYITDDNGKFIIENVLGMDTRASVAEPFCLFGVPIQQLRWGQFHIQCLPKKDDTGYIEVFVDDDTNWQANGGPSVPPNGTKFDIRSCVFVPFLVNKKNADPEYPTDNSQLVIKSANSKIVITDDGTSSSVEVLSNTVSVEAQDGISLTGDVAIDGKLSVTDKIESDSDITASGDVKAGNISLTNHTHVVNSGIAVQVDTNTGIGTTSGTGTTGGAQ